MRGFCVALLGVFSLLFAFVGLACIPEDTLPHRDSLQTIPPPQKAFLSQNLPTSTHGFSLLPQRQAQRRPLDRPFVPQEVFLPAGSFVAGSPQTERGRWDIEKQHDVTLTRAFWIGKYEVTQGEFLRLMGYNPSSFKPCGLDCPVETVSWNQAAAFCNAASRAKGLPECFDCAGSGLGVTCRAKAAYQGSDYYACLGIRLPTEAEWEYAYRAGSSTALPDGELAITDACTPLDPKAHALGWYCGNAQGKTHPVGQKQPNAWGLHDMAGNVWEWVYDGFASSPERSVIDPAKSAPSGYRVLRGGSWYGYAFNLRAAFRNHHDPSSRFFNYGFRTARSNP